MLLVRRDHMLAPRWAERRQRRMKQKDGKTPEIQIEQLEERIAPSMPPGLLGYEG
jgi:hypothetical protein